MLNDLPIESQKSDLNSDWLIDNSTFQVEIYRNKNDLVLSNGLIRRAWRLSPNFACVAFDNLMTGDPLLRSVRPEAIITINGQTFEIGGLIGQPNHAYLTDEFIENLDRDPKSMQFANFRIGTPKKRFVWKQIRHRSPQVNWPPKGITLEIDFVPPPNTDLSFTISICYEMYNGIPAMSKWLIFRNTDQKTLTVDRFVSEILALVPYEDPTEWRDIPITPPDLHVETDYAFGGFSHKNSSKHSVHWKTDPQFTTQVNYALQTPCLLEVSPPRGPDQDVDPNTDFESFRAFELVYDSTDRERKSLALRRLYRKIAPWITENPLILHIVSTDETVVKNGIDQASECGFEMISISFGSGLNMENESEENYKKFKNFADYARSKKLDLGGYSLLSSRRIDPEADNIINPETGDSSGQTHGYCPALASNWGQNYFRKLRSFFEKTGFLQFTHDGSYPGDVDDAERLPLQKGIDDSQWVQWKIITDFYKWQRSIGVYIRVPDYYFLSGSNEHGMGYREVNWSLPRVQQQIHTRQNIFDGSWEKISSMGWMFVPLTQYHGGGAATTIEPLNEHLHHYELMIASNLLHGVQAVYRGMRLFDTDETRSMVKRIVDLYKKYRDILESDLIHLRRANGRTIDFMLHVNPDLDENGFLTLFNPTDRDQSETIKLPLYFTGISEIASVSREDQTAENYQLDRHYCIDLEITVEANSYTWFVIRSPKGV